MVDVFGLPPVDFWVVLVEVGVEFDCVVQDIVSFEQKVYQKQSKNYEPCAVKLNEFGVWAESLWYVVGVTEVSNTQDCQLNEHRNVENFFLLRGRVE